MTRELAVPCNVVVTLSQLPLQIIIQLSTFSSLVEKGMVEVDRIIEDVLRIPIFSFSVEKKPHEFNCLIVGRIWIVDRVPAAIELFGQVRNGWKPF